MGAIGDQAEEAAVGSGEEELGREGMWVYKDQRKHRHNNPEMASLLMTRLSSTFQMALWTSRRPQMSFYLSISTQGTKLAINMFGTMKE